MMALPRQPRPAACFPNSYVYNNVYKGHGKVVPISMNIPMYIEAWYGRPKQAAPDRLLLAHFICTYAHI